jgi:hypothetical protein
MMLRRHIQTVRDALECESNELLGTDNELPVRLVGPDRLDCFEMKPK